MASVEVRQLQSKHGRAFLNTNEEYGNINVWGSCYKMPTYLLQDGCTYTIITFDNKEYAQEWFEEHSSKYFKITEISEVPRIDQ